MTAKLPPLGDRPRGSRVWCCSLRVADSDRHSATGLMARNNGQRGFEIPLAFCVAKISKPHRSIPSGVIDAWIAANAEEK